MPATIQRETPISLDRFGWDALERQARAERLDLPRLVEQACTYYEGELGSERRATAPPRFGTHPEDRETRTLTIELDVSCLRRLEQEAERHGLALERLVEHAALFYLADVEAGRVAERIARRARD